MKIKSFILNAGLSLALLLFLGCNKESFDGVDSELNLDAALTLKGKIKTNTYYGAQVKLGQGHVRT